MGQTITTTQFYLYGRSHFTATGYRSHVQSLPAYLQSPDILSSISLKEKTYIVTGASNGIGKEVTRFLFDKGATVYMICRDEARGEKARSDIMKQCSSSSRGDAESRLPILLCDCGLQKDVRRVWSEFAARSPRLDGLLCNAGALSSERTLTQEGVETTFATHLLYGTYLLGSLAMPTLQATPGSRLVMMSSGGMYNSKFPSWAAATSTGSETKNYGDGQYAYVYAKRGQVLLAEQWAKTFNTVKVVSVHPGWVMTDGVQAAYGEKKSYLEPLRSMWEGAEGTCWLLAAPADKIESGAFYLDRTPQTKHLAGPFFSEGFATKNSPEEIATMMAGLDEFSKKPPSSPST